MKAAEGLILALFFLLELCALAAFGYWGYHIHAGEILKIALAVAAPLIVAVLWGMFLSPKASMPIFSSTTRTVLKLLVFLLASAALYASSLGSLASVFVIASFLLVGGVFLLKLH
ncbi:YrdB family protein [Paenibacillus sp. HB172176]|uniref:YrdB family protein n=1 Tax=Paenibacillus sp. HB172176 TaxID=2493690 RepID=UPI00143C7C17|nr:YrdB family protein [Paenibacillus sp. HB172176]